MCKDEKTWKKCEHKWKLNNGVMDISREAIPHHTNDRWKAYKPGDWHVTLFYVCVKCCEKRAMNDEEIALLM